MKFKTKRSEKVFCKLVTLVSISSIRARAMDGTTLAVFTVYYHWNSIREALHAHNGGHLTQYHFDTSLDKLEYCSCYIEFAIA